VRAARGALGILLLALAGAAQTIQLDGGAFKVSGWRGSLSSEPSAVFPVYAGSGDVPPMLGKYAVEGGVLVFRPRFPLTPGVRYRAEFHTPGGATVQAAFVVPKTASVPSTRVERVYPSADVLPSNTLKLYILFSAPISRGAVWPHIRLLDESGKAVPLPFVEMEPELWDPEARRLTVLFDPGRIKRGLVPNQQMGAPIVEGKKYTLAIDREIEDARGVPLVEGFRRAFRGGPADRMPIDPQQWRLTEPKAGTLDPLTVDLSKPLDYALLQRLLTVPGVTGKVALTRQESEWRFTPAAPWKPGAYRLLIDPSLEDLAGNRVGRAFDVDVREHAAEARPKSAISLAFQVRQ
jgi:hypothetical protein